MTSEHVLRYTAAVKEGRLLGGDAPVVTDKRKS